MLEVNLYYSLKDLQNNPSIDDDFYFTYDEKMKELVNYVRYGKKGKIYDYEIRQAKEIVPSTKNDFVASVNISCNDKQMEFTLKLYELEFIMKI